MVGVDEEGYSVKLYILVIQNNVILTNTPYEGFIVRK